MIRTTMMALALLTAAPLQAQDTRAAVAAAVAERMDRAAAKGFTGSVLVADAEGVVFERSYGSADADGKLPIDAGTRFNLASAGKLFTIVATMQLVQAGKLDLDAPVGTYLPDWPVQTVREQVTARQLLMHTSGLGFYWGERFERMRGRLQTLSDYAPLLQQEPRFEPGSAWAYSNTGMMMLGLLIEKLSGQDYYAYVQRHVFDPAGMRDSGYFAVDGRADRVATPIEAGKPVPMPEPRGAAAGGGYSTPSDLLRFHRALTGGKLLDAKTLDQLFAPVTLPPGTRAPPHGLGILRYAAGDDIAYGHPGGAAGVGVDFRGLRESGWAVVIMANRTPPPTLPLAFDLYRVIAEAGGPKFGFALPR